MFAPNEDFTKYVILFCESFLVVFLAVVFHLLQEKTPFKKVKWIYRQIIIGVIFGGAAIFGTELGVNIGSSVANVRDAAPLVAGLIFGGPAGMIAATIGAVERILYTMVFHDMDGYYSMVACVIATFLSGLYAWILRKWFFENKTPNWLFGFATAAIMEVIHFIILYLGHIRDPQEVLTIIRNIALAMIIGNGLGVGLACFGVRLLEHEFSPEKVIDKRGSIVNKVQLGLLILILVTATMSTAFVITIQNNSANENADYALLINASDINAYITNSSNEIMLGVADTISGEYSRRPGGNERLDEIKSNYSVTAISVVAKNDITVEGKEVKAGDILYSTNRNDIGYNIQGYEVDDAYSYIHETVVEYGETVNYFNFSERYDEQVKVSAFTCYPYEGMEDYYVVVIVNKDDFYTLSSLESTIRYFTSYRRVFLNGYMVVFDADGNVVSDQTDHDDKLIGFSVEDLQGKESYKRYPGTFYGTSSYYMYTTSETFYVVSVIPLRDVTENRDMMTVIYSFMLALIYASVFFVSYILIQNIIIRNIRKINETLSLIMAGDLDQKVEVNSSSEFNDLSDDINITVGVLKDYIKEAEERIDKELAFAKAIQTSVLPSAFPAFPGVKEFDIYATMDTAREVGGDFYDFYFVDNNHVVFLVADVSGKGIPASMFMMEGKALIKNTFTNIKNVAEVFDTVNKSLEQGNDANMFITSWMGMINIKTGEVQFVNAGHNTPIIYSKEKDKWEYIKESRDVVLAIMRDSQYHVQTLKLNPGDRLYIYTDGVTESTSIDKTLYGEERLLKYLNKNKKLSIYKLLPGVKKDIDAFVQCEDQFDDITMLVLEYKGK